jgi:lysozyme family protein
MADVNLFAPKLFAAEGGYVNDPVDSGGETNKGVTLATLRGIGVDVDGDGDVDSTDLKALTRQQVVEDVLKPKFWDAWHADQIRNQSIAELLVSWVWGSGIVGIKEPQRVLGVTPDGVVGTKTLAAINDYPDQRELHQRLWDAYKRFIEDLVVRKPQNKRFYRGWINRLYTLKYAE